MSGSSPTTGSQKLYFRQSIRQNPALSSRGLRSWIPKSARFGRQASSSLTHSYKQTVPAATSYLPDIGTRLSYSVTGRLTQKRSVSPTHTTGMSYDKLSLQSSIMCKCKLNCQLPVVCKQLACFWSPRVSTELFVTLVVPKKGTNLLINLVLR